MIFNVIKHILPRARAWCITVDQELRQIFVGIGAAFDDVINYIDLMWLDMFPSTTRRVTQWNAQYGFVPYVTLTEGEQRARLAANWAAYGGQSPSYIQGVLQAAGFNVYVYDWWEAGAPPPVARNPYTALGGTPYGAGDPIMQAGEPVAQAGEGYGVRGYWLVNKLYTAEVYYTCSAGEPLAQAGEPSAQAGENGGILFKRVQYATPTDPDQWPYLMYVGGSPFGTVATVPSNRFEEFEDLLLRICPAHLWIGVLVDSGAYIIDDETSAYILDDETGAYLVE